MVRALARQDGVTSPRIRALGLLSGGLDSALAAKLLIDQGLEVIGLHLESPTACRSNVHELAGELGIELITRPKGEEYVKLLRRPKWGYGRHMNPCVDCRLFMFRVASEYLEPLEARFVFTGEVVGQRPMSQRRASLALVDRESGLGQRILRPLSARLLPETEPERRGWVDRSQLLAIQGRGRETQLALAAQLGLRHHKAPGGGCLLTDPHFSVRLEDLFAHQPETETRMVDLELLRLGRHVRVGPDLKVILGRDAAENRRLLEYRSASRWVVEPVGFGGPTALVCGAFAAEALEVATGLVVDHARVVPESARVRWQAADSAGERRVHAPRREVAADPVGAPLGAP
jgi:hypothetical protein